MTPLRGAWVVGVRVSLRRRVAVYVQRPVADHASEDEAEVASGPSWRQGPAGPATRFHRSVHAPFAFSVGEPEASLRRA